MHLKLLISTLLIFLLNQLHAQFEASFDSQTYVVQWSSSANEGSKEDFIEKFESRIICEMNFGDKEYAWLEFKNQFPQTLNDQMFIDINGGVIGAQSIPVVDGSTLDYYSDQSSEVITPTSSCFQDFDLSLPFGDQPVCLFNLDTGLRLAIDDSNTSELDFSGAVSCVDIMAPDSQDCDDLNGHGTHGAGIQMSLFNKSLLNYGGTNPVDLISYRVFNDNGVGNLGAILCALSDVLTHSAPRKVVNCSFSFVGQTDISSVFDPLQEAFTALAQQRVFSVVAAGNDSLEILPSYKVFPLCYFSEGGATPVTFTSSILGVGAADCDFNPASYSNYSYREVDVVTLGTIPGPDLGDGAQAGIDFYEGTSQATFAMSAVAAMLMSHQPIVDLASLKCSMINSSVYDPAFTKRNLGSGVFSASTAFLLMENGCTMPEPCPSVNVITGNINEGTYKATKSLFSNGYVASEHVTFHAQKSITLLAGFSAQPISEFHAFISACD